MTPLARRRFMGSSHEEAIATSERRPASGGTKVSIDILRHDRHVTGVVGEAAEVGVAFRFRHNRLVALHGGSRRMPPFARSRLPMTWRPTRRLRPCPGPLRQAVSSRWLVRRAGRRHRPSGEARAQAARGYDG